MLWHYHNDKPHGFVRHAGWKLIQYFKEDHYALYNLKNDAGETTDMTSQNPEKLKRLKNLIEKCRKKNAGADVSNPEYDPARQ